MAQIFNHLPIQKVIMLDTSVNALYWMTYPSLLGVDVPSTDSSMVMVMSVVSMIVGMIDSTKDNKFGDKIS